MSETITLITQAQQGDRTATERLVTENTGLIWSIARRYFGRGVEPDDLFQLGCVGFLKAVEGFDTAYGTQFSTYAVPMGLSPEEIASAETATSAAESIQRQTGEEGFSLEDVLCTDGMEEKLLEKLALREALRHLGEKERLVIQLRYYHSLTQQRVAELIGVSQVQVSRIEKKALERLRTFF